MECPEVACTECSWKGFIDDLENDWVEDEDGDMVGVANACPECGGVTVDLEL